MFAAVRLMAPWQNTEYKIVMVKVYNKVLCFFFKFSANWLCRLSKFAAILDLYFPHKSQINRLCRCKGSNNRSKEKTAQLDINNTLDSMCDEEFEKNQKIPFYTLLKCIYNPKTCQSFNCDSNVPLHNYCKKDLYCSYDCHNTSTCTELLCILSFFRVTNYCHPPQ